MKNINSTLVILFILIGYSNAQNSDGYYITLTNDTIRIRVDVPVVLLESRINYAKLQKKIKYFDASNEVQTLEPEQAKEITFAYNGEKIRMLSMPHHYFSLKTRDTTKIFLNLLVDGALKLFEYYEYPMGGNNSSIGGAYHAISEHSGFILQKNNAQILWSIRLSFKQELKDYLSDCPGITPIIEKTKYRKTDLELLVQEYNELCLKGQ